MTPEQIAEAGQRLARLFEVGDIGDGIWLDGRDLEAITLAITALREWVPREDSRVLELAETIAALRAQVQTLTEERDKLIDGQAWTQLQRIIGSPISNDATSVFVDGIGDLDITKVSTLDQTAKHAREQGWQQAKAALIAAVEQEVVYGKHGVAESEPGRIWLDRDQVLAALRAHQTPETGKES